LRWFSRSATGYPLGTGHAEPAPCIRWEHHVMPDPHMQYVAHHWIILAGPAFLPAIVVVGVVLYIALKDRRSANKQEHSTPDDKQD
jgi:hypothetical protein